MRQTDADTRRRLRRPLFRKYFLALFAAVVVPLLANGASEAWFGYRDQRASLGQRLHVEASAAAEKIQGFLEAITDQLQWMARLPWTTGTEDQHRLEALRLMRQVPAVVEITLIDGDDAERLRVSRADTDIVDSRFDRRDDPAVQGAHAAHLWYGPITFHQGSEPHMQIAMSGQHASDGVTIAVINLKLIWEVISAIRIGHSGNAFVLDSADRLIAHPDVSLVLRGPDNEAVTRLRSLQLKLMDSGNGIAIGRNATNVSVIAAMAFITGPGWAVLAEEPQTEAFAPIRAAAWRTALLLLGGALLAAALGYLLARRMTGPIHQLQRGAKEIGSGNFGHTISISTGDELEELASQFNEMATGLAESQERSERIARLKQFLSPQVAEIVENGDQAALLDSHRTEVVVLFCDLRGFTSFAGSTEPDAVMGLLQEYYEALGAIITRYEATLTCFMADGLMVLLNAPVPCPEPAVRGLSMALNMQASVQAMIAGWRTRGHRLGFGVGLAKGTATVGRIGYEGRSDYTAIGNVVNLAARMCGAAEDGQILIDTAAADEIGAAFPLTSLGARSLRGFGEPISVFSVAPMEQRAAPEKRPLG